MKKILMIGLAAAGVCFFGSLSAAEAAPAECQQYTGDIQSILPDAVAYGSMTARKIQLLDARNQVIGYLLLPAAGKRQRVEGYNGVVNAAVVVSPENKILGVVLGENGETPRFLERLRNAGFLKRWNGKTPAEASKLKVDAVTRATYSSNAIRSEVGTILKMQK